MSTSENVAQSYLFTPVKNPAYPYESGILTNYKAAASQLVLGWKNSPGHYKKKISSTLI